MRAVSVNGVNWSDFDVKKEWVRIARPAEPRYVITTRCSPRTLRDPQ